MDDQRERRPDEAVLVEGRPPPEQQEEQEQGGPADAIEHPAKVMRIASMARQLLDEVRAAPLDDASRSRLREIYQT
ncbi:MAG: proteasome activator, partial [Actinomycetota bacterium]